MKVEQRNKVIVFDMKFQLNVNDIIEVKADCGNVNSGPLERL